MREIPSGSVDMILTDPPYGTMKGAEGSNIYGDKDNPKHAWDTKIEHKQMLEECNRVLRKNGALVLFSQDPYTGELMTRTHGNLPFSYRYTWEKDSFAFALGCKKAPVNYTEDVCVFFKRACYEAKHPLKPLLLEVFNAHGKDACMSAMRSSGRFSTDESVRFHTSIKFGSGKGMVFELMTRELYDHVAKTIRIPFSYDYLKRADCGYKRAFARVFNLPEGKKYKSNILKYSKDKGGVHPTQKPIALLEDLIKTYTNEGQTVLDFTMGSGSTGVAAKNLGRSFIGIELDTEYYEIASARINAQAEEVGE
jgi:site-specific DNA-methyltransferase (adenine-specific)